ncbi:MAG: hypothetical protein A2W19_01630 [Spirochaetes bacterium RBG_16_49_21]|nr:MAG: hypothetical protein A2W19_01630 [Spirochaetes bacterium RBG_16_49_21]
MSIAANLIIMNTEEGTVVKVEGEKAWVLIHQSTMCDHCNSKDACHTLGGDKEIEAESFNTAGAHAGDRVLIKIKTKSLLGIAFIFYMFPAIALLCGAIIGMKLGPRYRVDPELAALLSAVTAFTITLILIVLIGKKLKRSREHMPEVVRILSSESKNNDLIS